MRTTLWDKYRNARRRELAALDALTGAAVNFAAARRSRAAGAAVGVRDTMGALVAAAKKHTNAAHQSSRCRKHLADAGEDV